MQLRNSQQPAKSLNTWKESAGNNRFELIRIHCTFCLGFPGVSSILSKRIAIEMFGNLSTQFGMIINSSPVWIPDYCGPSSFFVQGFLFWNNSTKIPNCFCFTCKTWIIQKHPKKSTGKKRFELSRNYCTFRIGFPGVSSVFKQDGNQVSLTLLTGHVQCCPSCLCHCLNVSLQPKEMRFRDGKSDGFSTVRYYQYNQIHQIHYFIS